MRAARLAIFFAGCCSALVARPRAHNLPRSRSRAPAAAPTMICPLAPLAPLWLAGKGATEARRKFFPEATPWPRAWEESDLWLEKSINFGTSAAAPAEKCPVPAEARAGLARPEDSK